MNRGIITSAYSILSDGSGDFHMGNRVSAADMRFYLLYWDRIVIPAENHVYNAVPDEDDLRMGGYLERPQIQPRAPFGCVEPYLFPQGVTHNSNDIMKSIPKAQFDIAKSLMKDDSTDWVINQSGEDFWVPNSDAKEREVLRIKLVNALPVPKSNVNINEVIEFKQRRENEFLALHETLDETYFSILNSPDTLLSSKKEVSRLKGAIKDLNEVSKLKFKAEKTNFDLSLDCNIDGSNIVHGVTSGALLGFLSSTDISLSSMLGGVASALKFRAKISKTFSIESQTNRLSYLSKANREDVLKLDEYQ
ncbi:DUF6236 family protein [Vibrio kanaloae]|uniref:DUF6236 family protein n=1 Tax=Vibrio kanaloae TaxID=170673 RepID=UPI0011B5EF02|nr:DUF6236 family protein [Vibrio kanaloae]